MPGTKTHFFPPLIRFPSKWMETTVEREGLDNSFDCLPPPPGRRHSDRLSIEFIACISRADDCTRRHDRCNLSSLGEKCRYRFIRRRIKKHTAIRYALLRVHTRTAKQQQGYRIFHPLSSLVYSFLFLASERTCQFFDLCRSDENSENSIMEEMTRRVNTLKVTKYTGLKLKLYGFEGRFLSDYLWMGYEQFKFTLDEVMRV